MIHIFRTTHEYKLKLCRIPKKIEPSSIAGPTLRPSGPISSFPQSLNIPTRTKPDYDTRKVPASVTASSSARSPWRVARTRAEIRARCAGDKGANKGTIRRRALFMLPSLPRGINLRTEGSIRRGRRGPAFEDSLYGDFVWCFEPDGCKVLGLCIVGFGWVFSF